MDKHVVHSRHRPALKRATDHPLRWAIDKATGEAVFVGTLAPDRNGNACGCKCPACNEDLQAVNADKPPEHFEKQNTRWKFFRHPSGHHRAGCSFLMAKLAALQLLMERGEIDLPAPRKRGLMQGISGTLYSAEAEGQRWCQVSVELRLSGRLEAVSSTHALNFEAERPVARVMLSVQATCH